MTCQENPCISSRGTDTVVLCDPSKVPFIINPSQPNEIVYTNFCKNQSIFAKAATGESAGSMVML
jgi:hypothetical protein